MRIQTKAKCAECGRVFDLLDEDDAAEFYYGHDCEDVSYSPGGDSEEVVPDGLTQRA